jgi:hypothetical protein
MGGFSSKDEHVDMKKSPKNEIPSHRNDELLSWLCQDPHFVAWAVKYPPPYTKIRIPSHATTTLPMVYVLPRDAVFISVEDIELLTPSAWSDYVVSHLLGARIIEEIL